MPEQLAIVQQGAGRCCASGCKEGVVEFFATARSILAIACVQCCVPCDGIIAIAGGESAMPTITTRRAAAMRLGRSPNPRRIRAAYNSICGMSTAALAGC